MDATDLNLLRALDALLAEESVAGAARRLDLSASAMSRTLARLREATGDPLLVRAGRGMVLTPHAAEMRQRVPNILRDVEAILDRTEAALDLGALRRVFTIRANEAFVVAYAAGLMGAVRKAAPGVRLRFAPKPDKDPRPLREGLADIEIGVLGETAPELKIQALFRDHFVGVVRAGHPMATHAPTVEDYAAADHVVASRRSKAEHPVDKALAELGLSRDSVLMVPSFPAALAVASMSDMVALVTRSFAEAELARGTAGAGPLLYLFDLPVRTDPVTVSQIWHPRMHNDPAHRWLRDMIRSCCGPGARSETPA